MAEISPRIVSGAFGLLEEKGIAFRDVIFKPNQMVHFQKSEAPDANLKLFATCSYMGLSYYKPALKALANGARKQGLDLRVPGFVLRSNKATELESLLQEIFGGLVFIGASTSVASQAFLYACVEKTDTLIFEEFRTHGSILQASGLPGCKVLSVSMMKHPKEALAIIAEAATNSSTVWYVADAVDSASGSYFPASTYRAVLDASPRVKLFIDDAHGVFTTGPHGCGVFLRDMPLTNNPDASRLFVAGSLNKAFAGDGGFVVFGDPDMHARMRRCAMPQYFSGSIKPPFLYADVALARFFLSPLYEKTREELEKRCFFVHNALAQAGICSTAAPEVPLKSVHVGLLSTGIALADAMARRGFWVLPMPFPGVARGHATVRFCLNAGHSWEDVRAFTAAFIDCCPKNLPAITERVRDPLYDSILGVQDTTIHSAKAN